MNLKSLIRKAKEDALPRKGAVDAATGGNETPAAAGCEAAGESAEPRTDPPRQLSLPAQLVQVADEHRVGSIPSVWVAEEWLPLEAEAQVLAELRARARDFVPLRGKRTARFGGDVGPPFAPETLPPFLAQLCAAVGFAAFGNTSALPNHVLVNHYSPGEGIMPHTDGPAYEPRAAILSLCSAVTFDFWRDHAHTNSGEPPSLSVLLPPRSLLLFQDEAYGSHLHGIAGRRYDELEPQAVANWLPDQQQRFNPASPEAPVWATRQLQGSSAAACSLQRDERYSLTIRRVPLADG